MSGATGSGSLNVVGYAIEGTNGTYTAPAHWLYPETNTLAKDYDFLTKKVMSGSRASTRVARPTLVAPAGAFTLPLFATHGAPILKPTLGADTLVTALTADTVKAATPVTTTNGVSTITLTNTGGVSYTVGALVKINTGLSSECRQILTITGNGAANTVITVPALVTNAAAAAGTAVQQIVVHKFTTTPTSGTLPSLSIEDNNARQYSYKYAGVYVDKASWKASKDEISAQYDLIGTSKPVPLASPTSPSPSAAEQSDMLHPFTITDGTIAAYGDVTATGVASYGGAVATAGAAGIQQLIGLTDFQINWQNGLLKKPAWNLSGAYRVFPGEQDCTVSFSYIDEAKRDAEWDDYLGQLSNQTAPFYAAAAINTSTTSTEAWIGVAFYIPALVYKKATPVKAAGDVIGQKIEMQAVSTTASGDLMQVFISNADSQY